MASAILERDSRTNLESEILSPYLPEESNQMTSAEPGSWQPYGVGSGIAGYCCILGSGRDRQIKSDVASLPLGGQ